MRLFEVEIVFETESIVAFINAPSEEAALNMAEENIVGFSPKNWNALHWDYDAIDKGESCSLDMTIPGSYLMEEINPKSEFCIFRAVDSDSAGGGIVEIV